MNLILSDVEETIMIVEQQEGAPGVQHTVNASLFLYYYPNDHTDSALSGCKAQDGYVVRTRRWCDIGACDLS